MSEFLELVPPPEALARFMSRLPANPDPERITVADAAGRVTTEAITAPLSLPSFPRSTVDGYAVRAADTYGASESLPAYLTLVGEVPMGFRPDFTVAAGQCALIHTGGMLPDGTNAVIMIEYTQQARSHEIEILRALGDGENILQIGEDVREGDEVIASGTRLRAAEIGGLAALGITELTVARPPRVAILSSGDEVVPPGHPLGPGQVHDVNSYTLSTLVTSAGGTPVRYGIIPDQASAFRDTAQRALSECDIVVFTAGSSVSVRDLTAETIDSLGKPGVLVHGVSVRPGKPTILAVCEGKAVIGLPGNPVSALIIAGLFLVPVIEARLGLSHRGPRPSIRARLTVNLASQAGREDWIPVRLLPDEDGIQAEPVFGKSNLIFTLARADGLVRIPPEANGIETGERVDVLLL